MAAAWHGGIFLQATGLQQSVLGPVPTTRLGSDQRRPFPQCMYSHRRLRSIRWDIRMCQ
jgi:hypothetical protein